MGPCQDQGHVGLAAKLRSLSVCQCFPYFLKKKKSKSLSSADKCCFFLHVNGVFLGEPSQTGTHSPSPLLQITPYFFLYSPIISLYFSFSCFFYFSLFLPHLFSFSWVLWSNKREVLSDLRQCRSLEKLSYMIVFHRGHWRLSWPHFDSIPGVHGLFPLPRTCTFSAPTIKILLRLRWWSHWLTRVDDMQFFKLNFSLVILIIFYAFHDWTLCLLKGNYYCMPPHRSLDEGFTPPENI